MDGTSRGAGDLGTSPLPPLTSIEEEEEEKEEETGYDSSSMKIVRVPPQRIHPPVRSSAPCFGWLSGIPQSRGELPNGKGVQEVEAFGTSVKFISFHFPSPSLWTNELCARILSASKAVVISPRFATPTLPPGFV